MARSLLEQERMKTFPEFLESLKWLQSKRRGRVLWLACGMLLITTLHYLTPILLHQYHAIFAKLYFIPIVLGSFWFGLGGGLFTAGVIVLAYMPHVIFQWHSSLFSHPDQYLEMFMYLATALIIGILSDIEKHRVELLREQSSLILEMEDQLQEADELAGLGELSAGLAHELRTPLNAIIGFSEMLSEGYVGALTEAQSDYLSDIGGAARQLLGLVSDVPDLAKAAGRALPRPEQVRAGRRGLARRASPQRKGSVSTLRLWPPTRAYARLDPSPQNNAVAPNARPQHSGRAPAACSP